MLKFLSRHRQILTVLALVGFSYFVFSLNIERRRTTTWYDQLLLWTIAPLQDLVTSSMRAVHHSWNHYVFLVGLVDENEKLRRRIVDLEFKHEELIESALENERLRKLLLFQERIVAPKISAEVIALDLSTQFQMVRINRGSSDGVVLGMPVLGAGGVVGQIFRVTGAYSDVLLGTDRNSAIDAVVQRSRARGVIVGAGRKSFDMRFKYLSREDDVKLGDLVITSGLDGVFPEGLSIGYVIEVDRPDVGILQAAQIQPTVEFDKIKEVMVILRQDRPGVPEIAERGTNG